MNVNTFILTLILALLSYVPTVHAQKSCPTFTHEQDILIRKAHAIGNYADLGYTLAAITWKESIVGRYIVRINANDGRLGSYGVGNMLLTTAMELVGEDNYWRAKSTLAMELINDDVKALEMSLRYLNRHRSLGWREMIAKYNGAGPDAKAYQQDVIRRVKSLQSCLSLDA